VCDERRVGCWCVVDRGFRPLRLFWRSTYFKSASASRNSKAGKAPKKSTASDNAQSNMPAAIRNTVDRLDKPSAYYQSRVSNSVEASQEDCWTDNDFRFQNKKRKYDRDGDDERQRTPDEPAEDPLKDATTLYVGNLYAYSVTGLNPTLTLPGLSTQPRSRFTNCFLNAGRSSA
jgi:hypothetical protein